MAQFKDLIVSGASRFIGKAYGSTFVGYLNGNADSATLAIKDANGKNITEYISNLTINGNIITYTDGAGVSKTLTIHDTTYDQATSSSLGLTKLYDGIGSETDGAMTQAAASEALAGKLASTGTANKAISDSEGQKIDSTYIKGAEVNGQQLTFTKGDGSTFNLITQDNNTTYGNFSTASAGLVPQSSVGKEDFALTGDGTFKDITQFKVNNASTADYARDASTAAFARSAETATNASTATNDAAGQKIDSTYIKNLDVSGRTVTVTKGDGTTSSFLTQDTNTEYSLGNSETNGLTKLYGSTGSNSDGSIVQSALTSLLDNKLNKNATAAAANKDAAGQDIDTTYIKGATVNGRQVTFTKGDGSTFSLYTQDTNTEYSTGDPITSGLTKLYGYTGDNTDGTMTQNAITIALADKVDKGAAVEAATKDGMGQNITLTYLKNVSVDGQVVTFTKGDNSTFSITTQDNNTTYSQATSATAGVGKLYGNTGVAEDGALTQAAVTEKLAEKLPSTATAVAAVKDNIGQEIDSTYIKNANVSGTKVTFTKGDGSTFAITTQDTNDNTTYSTGTSVSEGLTKLYDSPGDNSDGALTQAYVTAQLNSKLASTGTATKATGDSQGQKIDETYIKNADISGKDITFTKGDNSTFHITTQDTTYSAATSVSAGLTKLYGETGNNSDGAMTQSAVKAELDGKLSTAGTAAAAVKDNVGQTIDSTYIKGFNVEGKKVTVTKGDGTTAEYNTQDTTYSTGTSESAGITKLYNTTGSNTDGSITQDAVSAALDGKLSTAGTAAKATADATGQNIAGTYIASVDVSGRQVTFTKGNGSTFAVETQDTNTEYSTGNSEVAGLTKLYPGAGANTDGTMTQAALQSALNGKLATTGTASKAISDNSDQPIDETYIKSASVSGRVVTFTKGNDSTFSITTQDNDTTYSDATSATAGLIKSFASTGSNTDGTMTQKAISEALSSLYTDLNTKIGNINSFEVVVCSDADDLPAVGAAHTIYFVPDDTGSQNKYVEYIWVEDDGYYEEIGSTAVDLSGYYTSGQTDSAITTATNGSIVNVSVNGTTMTFTKKDGSTFTLNTQDNNTTYATGTDTVEGLTKLYGTTGTNTDGTMTQSAIKTQLDTKLATTGTAAAAANDSAGQDIHNTYIKNASVDGQKVTFTKGDGSTFQITTQDTNDNTTYSTGTTAVAGLTKIYTSTGSNSDGTMAQDAITNELAGKLSTAGTAAKATADSAGQNITTTYLKNAEVDGKVVTFTKGDGSTFTITTQDTNTTYSDATSASAGLVKLYSTTGSNDDGAISQDAVTTALSGKLNTTATAAAANKDGSNQNIADTYIKDADVVGRVVTFTKGNGDTFSITTQDNNTTYAQATSETAGLVTLFDSTGSSTQGTMDQNAITTALAGKLNTDGTAAAAVKDSANNVISSYVKDASVNGTTVTFTKGDGSTFTINTQDTNTEYGTGSSATAGLTKLYGSTGSNGDGAMTQKAVSDIVNDLDTNKLATTATAAAAIKDGDGQQINTTYLKEAALTGNSITFTKGDGSTFNVVTPNTTYSEATSATAGLLKVYPSTGTNTDGTMDQRSITAAMANSTVSSANNDGKGQQIDSTYIANASVAGQVVTFTKGDGSTFTITTQDNNTTYATGTSVTAGLTKLYDSSGSASDGTMTQAAIATAIAEGNVSAATKDSAGQQINSTYIKGVSVDGTTVTFTKGDNSTFAITTQDNDTTYSIASSTSNGLTRLYGTTGTNANGSITQDALTSLLNGKLATTATAAAATNDSAGNDIHNTYIANASVSGQVVTFTKGDGSTFSITTQDSNTIYSDATSETAGIAKLYGTTGTNSDGAMTQASITTALATKMNVGDAIPSASSATADAQGQNIANTYIKNADVAGQTVTFTKGDGSTFSITTQDNNTTYTTGTSGSSGLTKLYSGTGDAIDGAITQASMTTILDGKLSTAGTAAAATKDSGGNTINTTYIKNVNVSGKTVTFTKGDNSTFSIDTQDSNTTYSTGTSETAGLTKLYTGGGSNEDGTMTQKAIGTALEAKLSTAGTAAAAEKDGSNQNIAQTYIKAANVDGRVVTFTRGDASTFSITTQDTNDNTTYSTGTSSSSGLTKLYNGVGSNEDGTITQAAIQTALEAKLSTAGTAAAAVKDNKNQTIDETYIKTAGVSGQVVTFTKGDGSTFSITTQDNNTTYDVGTTGTAGLTKLYSGIGENTDGTMTQAAINTALNGKLSTAGTAAAAVKDNKNQTIDETYIKTANSVGAVVTFTKGDGSTFSINTQDENTTYSTGTTAVAGLTKLYTGVGENEDGTMTQKAIGAALDGKLSTAGTAAAATKDGSNNIIAETYIKNAQVSGQTVTFTKGDSSTFTITTQDSNTTYSTGTSESAGLTKLYGTTGSNTDGTMTQSAIGTALDGKLSTAGTAAAATKDAKNQTIDQTYIKNASVSGKTVTFTKGDGSTFTVTTQDTTYETGTSATAGLTKLYTGIGSNTDGTMTQAAINTALDGKLSSAGTAAAATKDGSNQNIAATYIKAVNVNGTSVTFTKGDNSTFSITTQDTNDNTTYSTGTSSTSGLTKLYGTTGTNSDGAINQNAMTTLLAGKLDTDGTVAAATKDGSNQNIAATYIKSLSADGRTITVTKGDGTTSTFQTQDTVAQNATSTTAGLVKLYNNTTGSNTDGSPSQYAVNAALDTKLNTTATASAAQKDNAGQVIDSTYIKSASASGTSITFTRGNGTTFVITSEDNVVAQNYTTASENKPLLMGYNSSTQSVINTIYQAQDKIYANPNTGSIYATSFVGTATSATNAATATYAQSTLQCSKVTGSTTANSLDGDLMFDFGYEASTVSGDVETLDISGDVSNPQYGMFIRNGSGGMTRRTVTNNATFSNADSSSTYSTTYYSGNEYSDVIEKYLFN